MNCRVQGNLIKVKVKNNFHKKCFYGYFKIELSYYFGYSRYFGANFQTFNG